MNAALDGAARERWLAAVLQRCAPSTDVPRPVVVFDLDGTLLDNRPRTAAILRSLAPAWQGRDRDAMDRLAALTGDAVLYDVGETLARAGITDAELVTLALAHWNARFFRDEWLHHDAPAPGAVGFARACHDAGAHVVYFTGRDVVNMAQGTSASLTARGFPWPAPRTHLVQKPDPAWPDLEFKRDAAGRVLELGQVIAAFDNEPANCNLFAHLAPAAHVALLHTGSSPHPPPLDPRVAVLRDFTRGAP